MLEISCLKGGFDVEKFKVKFQNTNFKINLMFVASTILIVVFTIIWQMDLISELVLQIVIGFCFGILIIYEFLISYADKKKTQKKSIIWLKLILLIGFVILIAFTYFYILGFFVYLIGG